MELNGYMITFVFNILIVVFQIFWRRELKRIIENGKPVGIHSFYIQYFIGFGALYQIMTRITMKSVELELLYLGGAAILLFSTIESVRILWTTQPKQKAG